MSALQKVAYLKGLVEGLSVSGDTNEGKVFAAIIDALDSLASEVDALGENAFDIADEIDALSSDLSDVEAVVFGDRDDRDSDEDECSCCGDDELEYEIDCPSCGEEIAIDEQILASGEIVCPKCGEKLEFDYDEGAEE
ncbi:MAG: hypothetical protein GX847_08540 [Clostridiales bacterium]|nr:hypothetical protein [Clostridiales bacterium]